MCAISLFIPTSLIRASTVADEYDIDDDNDNYTDEEEMSSGTNPLDPMSYPKGNEPLSVEYVLVLVVILVV